MSECTHEGVTHGYIDTPGVVYVVPWATCNGPRFGMFHQMVISYGTYPGYAGVWPVYAGQIGEVLTAEEVGQELGGN